VKKVYGKLPERAIRESPDKGFFGEKRGNFGADSRT
jgi:hypothetical protein